MNTVDTIRESLGIEATDEQIKAIGSIVVDGIIDAAEPEMGQLIVASVLGQGVEDARSKLLSIIMSSLLTLQNDLS